MVVSYGVDDVVQYDTAGNRLPLVHSITSLDGPSQYAYDVVVSFVVVKVV
jgi:hypothetical protein